MQDRMRTEVQSTQIYMQLSSLDLVSSLMASVQVFLFYNENIDEKKKKV